MNRDSEQTHALESVRECGKTSEVEAEYQGYLTGIYINLTCTPDSMWCGDTNSACYDGFKKQDLVNSRHFGESLGEASLRLRRARRKERDEQR